MGARWAVTTTAHRIRPPTTVTPTHTPSVTWKAGSVARVFHAVPAVAARPLVCVAAGPVVSPQAAPIRAAATAAVHNLLRIACSSVHVDRDGPGPLEAVVARDASDRRRAALRRNRPSTLTIDPDAFARTCAVSIWHFPRRSARCKLTSPKGGDAWRARGATRVPSASA